MNPRRYNRRRERRSRPYIDRAVLYGREFRVEITWRGTAVYLKVRRAKGARIDYMSRWAMAYSVWGLCRGIGWPTAEDCYAELWGRSPAPRGSR